MLAIWSLAPLPFLNPAWTSGSSQFMYCWSLSWRMLSIYFASMWSEVAQSCPTLCDPMVCSLSASSVHGIFQARILEWVAIAFSRDLPYQGSNPGLLHCRQTFLPSEPPGKHFTIMHINILWNIHNFSHFLSVLGKMNTKKCSRIWRSSIYIKFICFSSY